MNHLIPFWFIVIAILWTGFFILEGFDFGVGMLMPVLAGPCAGLLAGPTSSGSGVTETWTES